MSDPAVPGEALDALIERLREHARLYRDERPVQLMLDAAAALVRVSEREALRVAELAEVREAFQNNVHYEVDGPGVQPCICGNEWICPRWAEPTPEDYRAAHRRPGC